MIFEGMTHGMGPMTSQEAPERLGKRVYCFAAVLGALGLANLFILVFKPAINPFLALFLYSIPSNSAVSVFPHEPVIVFCGSLYSPLVISLVAGAATCVAGFLDYQVFTPLLNLQALDSLKDGVVYRKSVRYFAKMPFLIILIAGFSPIPFVPIKILAFSSRYPLRRYIAALFLARAPRYYILALIGEFFDIPNWILLAIFALIFGYVIVKKGVHLLRRGRREQNA